METKTFIELLTGKIQGGKTMTLTEQQREQLKKNCLAIKDWLIDLVKDNETDITLKVEFRRYEDNHRLGISICKDKTYLGVWGASERVDRFNVEGFIGGLPIRFEENNPRVTTAWDYQAYGIELLRQWKAIKQQFMSQYENEKVIKQMINDFEL